MSQTGKTRILRLTRENESQVLQEASLVIERSELLIFPTDTVYGIGGAAFSPQVHRLLTELKGTREQKAYALLISSIEIMERIAGRELEGSALRLAQEFWPGALTIVWYASLAISREHAAPDGSIAYRLPDHAFVRNLLTTGDGALWATSVNRPNAQPPAVFEEIENIVMEQAALAIDGGETLSGIASTVVDVRTRPIKIMREGAISGRDIRSFLGEELQT